MIGAAADPGEYDPAALAEEAEAHERLAAAIRRLPGGPGEAAAAELLEGKTVPEIAARLHRSDTTVRKYLREVHQRLLEDLAPQDRLNGVVAFATPPTPAPARPARGAAMAEADGQVSWVHLSDLHANNPHTGWDARRVLATLVDDLKRAGRMMAAGDGWPPFRPDFLFFTGDLAFGHVGDGPGQTLPDQFHASAAFLEGVRTAFSLEIPPDRVFLVPGNHDVDRRLATEDQAGWLDTRTSVEPVERMIRDKGVQWTRYMERLGAYGDFLASEGYEHLAGPTRSGSSTPRCERSTACAWGSPG